LAHVVDADIFTVGTVNSIIIDNAEKQVYAHDFSFNYMRPFPEEIGSGATLVQHTPLQTPRRTVCRDCL